MANFADTVERFAAALDNDDFAAASNFLEEDCHYLVRGTELNGREAIIASFRNSSEWAHATFDQITYRHSLEAHAQSRATIRFTDIFEHSGRAVMHECLMHVTSGNEGRLAVLTLEEDPADQERVEAFLESVGLKR